MTKRLQTKMVTEETHSCKEKLEARQLFSLVHGLDLVELFASIIVFLSLNKENIRQLSYQ